LAIAQPHWIEDLCQLSWAFHDRCADLFLCKRMESNPSFEGSVDVDEADADLIVDRCLIELKTTVKRKREWSVWIRQLLGYVLLDYSNQHQIEAVAIYLARQGVLLRWPLSELLGMLSTDGCEPVLKDLRTALRRVLIARR
jgi:hypothetical protein